MSKVVIFNFGRGTLETGFPQITVNLSQDGLPIEFQKQGNLPPAPKVEQFYQRWKLLYECCLNYLKYSVRLEIVEDETILQFSEVDFERLGQQLITEFNDWLNSPEFLTNIQLPLSRLLHLDDEIRVIIQTNDRQLRELPWHLWKFFESFPKAEIVFGAPEFQCQSRSALPLPGGQSQTPSGKVRILGILGNSTGIDLERDRQLLSSLSGVDLHFLNQPNRQQLNDTLWDTKGWDILFFAGHSQTEGEIGRIYINPHQSLTITELKHALKTSIARGLQLAIFNSCDGLGLAQQLEELHIPQVIVMRHPVSDRVAQSFLKHFLTSFAGGESFAYSLRQAREKLQGLEDEFPCASWLPIAFQNTAIIPPTWQELKKGSTAITRPFWKHLQTSVAVSAICTGLTLGLRSLGLLQGLELQALDCLMQMRPVEPPDPRLLLITITEADVRQQPLAERGAASLSDRALAQLMAKLEQSSASVIGLDIYRESPVKREYRDLAKQMKNSDRFLSICKYGNPGVLPPPEVPGERQGFNNVLLDSDDLLRRQLLAVESPQPCQSQYSFNLQLVKRYLARNYPKNKFIPKNADGYLQIGNTVFKTLEADTGGYNALDSRGHQILINYRIAPQIAEKVTLGEFLERYNTQDIGDPRSADLGNRIVLIGTVAPSFNDDRWDTPMATITGLEVQAHLISHLLSVILDGRPLIWSFPKSAEAIWIGAWSLLGGLLVLGGKYRFAIAPVALLCLGGSCWILLLVTGCWLPLVPSAIAFIAGGTIITLKKILKPRI
jgi:CHASE2 domain-containing sensor protein